MTNLSRRSLVAAAPAAVIAATLPARAGATPDAALLALREPYERTLAAMVAAAKPHSRAEDACFAMAEAQPHLDERARRKASGLTKAERVWNRAISANDKVIRQIAEQPARTIEGAIFKARVSDREDNMDRDLVASIVADLIAMGGAHA